jgi:uncharacterized protein (DUF1501 family)
VQGTGRPVLDLSHFDCMAAIMSATSDTSRSTGWLGRFLDGVSEWDSGLRGAAMGPNVPLHLVGTRAKVTAVPTDGVLWGGGTNDRWERSAQDAVRAMGAAPTGLGPWADRVAATGGSALDQAATVSGILSPPPGPGLAGNLRLAARLLNADLGVRAVTATLGGWDTHALQLATHAYLLGELDRAVDAFFAELQPRLAAQTTLVVVSEFGRRALVNSSQGTDHGSASHILLVGDRVRGGLHGAYPSLSTLDSSGSLAPTVDFRSVYATILDRWLGADADAVLGARYERLDLFTTGPGA